MDYLIQFFCTNWESVVLDVVKWMITALLAIVAMWFHKAIIAVFRRFWYTIRRRYKKLRRWRLSQCLPSHTIEYIRLKRQLRKLEFHKQKEKEQNKELEKNIIILLTWASKFRYFHKEEVLKAMHWNRSYTYMIFGLAVKREHLKLIDSRQALFSITTEGRELLYRRGILRA